MKKKLFTAVLAGALFCGTLPVSASSNFFADVPADDWSYTAINELIQTGKVSGYSEPIPSGRIMSRLEMAMIIEEAQRNPSAFNEEERALLERLGKEYFYDVKKIQLLNKLDSADEQSLERSDDFTPEEKNKIKNLVDRFSFNGYVRFRNDHFIKHDKRTNEKSRTTRANMVHLQVATHYKINDDRINGKAPRC